MSETSYTIENAKSGRSSCKKCKEKIEKGGLRIGTHAPGPGDYNMSSWCHPKCFVISRKLKKEGTTAETFVKDLLMDETADKCLPEIEEEIIQAIDSKPAVAVTGSATGTTKMNKIKEDLEKIRKTREMDTDENTKPKKKSKLNSKKADKGTTSMNDDDTAVVTVYEKYEKYTNDELKDVLRWNRQLISGTKNVLFQRIIDGHMNGRLGMCPSCSQGKLKLKDEDGETVFCNGYFDEEAMARIPCYYTCKRPEAARLHPWFIKKPTDEENEEIEASMKAGSNSSTGEGVADDSPLSKLTILAQKVEDDGDWNLGSGKGMKAAAKVMVELCTGKMDLPTRNATMEIGKVLITDRSISAVEFVKVLADKFGFVQENVEAKQRKTKSISVACGHPGNGPLMMAIVELGDLYYKEKNTNAGNTYKKVAEAIKNMTFEINEDNAKGLGKGKTKVAGVGKGSAEKMYEFVTTGSIAKLEEKRASQ